MTVGPPGGGSGARIPVSPSPPPLPSPQSLLSHRAHPHSGAPICRVSNNSTCFVRMRQKRWRVYKLAVWQRERERELAMAEFLRSRSSTTSSLAMQESGFKASLARCVLRSSLCTYTCYDVCAVVVFQKLCVFVNKGTDLMKGDTFGLRCVYVCVCVCVWCAHLFVHMCVVGTFLCTNLCVSVCVCACV